MTPIKVALAPFLRSCTAIVTLEVRPTIEDYSSTEKALLRRAERVFFPTPRYAYLFDALHIPVFPTYTTYRFQRSRVLQQILFAVSGMPHPPSRIYYGRRQKETILDDFSLPVVIMGPDATLHNKRLVEHATTLEAFAKGFNPVIVQEALDWTERVRILCVHLDCVGAVRLERRDGLNSSYEPTSMDRPDLRVLLETTRDFARKAHLDDVVIEWAHGKGRWHVLGLTRPPVRWPMLDGVLNRHHYIGQLVESGQL
jgi:ribosomal protein S6--L-glutamate ligase